MSLSDWDVSKKYSLVRIWDCSVGMHVKVNIY